MSPAAHNASSALRNSESLLVRLTVSNCRKGGEDVVEADQLTVHGREQACQQTYQGPSVRFTDSAHFAKVERVAVQIARDAYESQDVGQG
jgi:hypothetical protein